MAGVIDTNILLYAANAEAEEHPAARKFLTNAATSARQWYLTEGILYEFLRVATHARVFPQPLTKTQALAFVEALWTTAAFSILGAGARHWDLLKQELQGMRHAAGNLYFDLRTIVLMREHGVRVIYTADTDFLQFRDVEVVNPLRGLP